MFVQHGLVLVARRTPTRPVLSPGELEAFLLLPLARGLFVRPPSHLWLEAPPFGGARGLLGPKLPPRLGELGFDLRPREIAAERCVRDAVTRPYAERADAVAVCEELNRCFAGRRVRGGWYRLTLEELRHRFGRRATVEAPERAQQPSAEAEENLPSGFRRVGGVPLWGDSDGWPRTAEEHAQRDAHYSARRDLSDADRLDYNTVVKFGGQTAAERCAVSQEKRRSRDLARAKRTSSRDP
ncbi:MAG: hypothetical protein M3P00_02340 [Gemmatimonadota bacterium]|nr:hypothetical protein [Gemmatimonadota bacterium]